jgi:hypothetical protein
VIASAGQLPDFALCPFQRRKVIRPSRSAPGTSRDPSDVIAPEHCWAINQRSEQTGFLSQSLGFSGARPKRGLAEFDKLRHLRRYLGEW